MTGISNDLYSHLEAFLGPPDGRTVHEFDGIAGSLQILEFRRALEGCRTFCSFGFSKSSSLPHQEAIVAIDHGFEEIAFILAATLFYYWEFARPLSAGESKAGWSDLREEFARRCGKDAFYFMPPFPFGNEFAISRSSEGDTHILLAVPISKPEHRYLTNHGVEAFEEMMESSGIDPFHLMRESAVDGTRL